MADLKLIETGNGGDLELLGRDLAVVQGFGNMPYLAMFGGNVEASTPRTRVPGEQAFDFWGNSLFHPNNTAVQFNSLTERRLMEVALNSSGRLQIEQAVKRDLAFMKPFAEVTVSVEITGPDRVRISILLKEPGNLQEKQFIYIWDGTRLDLEGSTPAPAVTAIVQPINHAEQFTDSLSPDNILPFDAAYGSTAYTPVIIDRGGADLEFPTLGLFTNKMELQAHVPGSFFTWVTFSNAPNSGYRTGQTTLTAGLNNIPFPTFGHLDYTLMLMDKDKVGVDYSTLTRGFGSFSVNVPVNPGSGKKLYWVAVKNNYFDNMRIGYDVAVAAGGVTIPYSSSLSDDTHTLMLMDLVYGPGNIINVTKTAAGYYVEVGISTRFNHLAIE